MKHFLHPKLLRKAREVRGQLEDILKTQKLEILSVGTDWDVVRSVRIRLLNPPYDVSVADASSDPPQEMHHRRVLPSGRKGQGYRRVHELSNGCTLIVSPFHQSTAHEADFESQTCSILQAPCVLHPTSALYGLGCEYFFFHIAYDKSSTDIHILFQSCRITSFTTSVRRSYLHLVSSA
jgi:hypothetical protein